MIQDLAARGFLPARLGGRQCEDRSSAVQECLVLYPWPGVQSPAFPCRALALPVLSHERVKLLRHFRYIVQELLRAVSRAADCGISTRIVTTPFDHAHEDLIVRARRLVFNENNACLCMGMRLEQVFWHG